MTNTNTSNRFNNQGNAAVLLVITLLLIAGAIYLEAWWLQSILFAFTNVLYSKWITGGTLILVGLVTPKNLQGVPLFMMVLAQLYIWFFMV